LLCGWLSLLARKSISQVKVALRDVGGFASAQEIYHLMHRGGATIGLTTVYRSLQSLVEENEVDVLHRSDGEAMYRLCGENHHHHLVCTKCGRTIEIEGGPMEKWAKSVGAAHEFRDVSHTVELFGTCSRC
jgi:Fur family ferric uptake transcriptional regulator